MAGLHGQIVRRMLSPRLLSNAFIAPARFRRPTLSLSPCRQSTADIIGKAFRRRQVEESSEFSVNKLVLCAGRRLDLVPFLGETNVIDVMFLRSGLILSAPVAGTVADWSFHQKSGTLFSQIGTCSNLADKLIRA